MKINIIPGFFLAASLAAALMALPSCNYDDADDVDLVELGATSREYVFEAENSSQEIQVYSNGPYHVEFVDNDVNWLSLNTLSGDGDAAIEASCTFNEEFKRMTKIVFCSDVDSRRDTVSIKQKGLIDANLSKANTSVILAGAGGTQQETVTTNVPFAYMDVVKTYSSETDTTWLQDISISGEGEERTLSITSSPNPDSVNPRTATVLLSYTDGWGDAVSLTLNIVQRNSAEGLGRTISMKDLYDTYATGKEITDYVIVSGIVVSSKASGNAGENEQVTTSAIDYTGSQKTVYLEAEDGSKGVCLTMTSGDDNVFDQFDKVQILLHGTTATLYTDPDRVVIKNVAQSMVVSRSSGTKADVPVKEKRIGELTDDDVYTYVTLKDVELPVRKGALCPANEGYTIASNANRLSKYPLMVRDIDGNHLYMYTNTVCVYRNDGTRLPYGSGKISGVIVHERFSRFEWRDGADPLEMEEDPDLGNIGRYQIRHMSKEDVWGQMNDSVENSFSALLTEYRFVNPDREAGVSRPTYGENGWFTHTYQEKYTGTASKDYTNSLNQHMYGGGTYEYLGPIGTNANYLFGLNIGNVNGIGVVLDLSKEHYSADLADRVGRNADGTVEWCGPTATNNDCKLINNQSSSMRGKGNVYGNCYTAFASNYWWDYDTNRPYGWLLNFSTEGITTDHISLQISVLNTQQTWYAPRFWKAEWALTDSQAAKDDYQWNLIANYTVPDVSVWSNTLYSSIVAYKTLDFELPLDILGQPNVYIRLVPVSDVCSDGGDYANARLSGATSETAHASSIEYIAVRYNK